MAGTPVGGRVGNRNGMSIRLQDIYDIEGALDRACKPVFDAAGLTVITTQVDPKLQRTRPRVEMVIRRGAGLGRWLFVDIGDGQGGVQRQQAWRIGLQFSVITDADIAAHTAYKSNVLALLWELPTRINGVSLLYHCLMPWESDDGATTLMKSAEGYYRSDLNFSSSIAIQADAWAQVDPNLT